MGCNQLYSLSWGDFGTSLSSTVQILRGHGDLVDVTLAAGGKIFPAHKLVLSAASPLLMELLKSTQCQHPVVMLAGITATDLEALLQFVYQGEVSVDPNQLPSLLQAAQCLDIQALSPASLSSDVCTTYQMLSNKGLPTAVGGTHHEHHGVSRGTMMPCVTVRKRKRKARLTYATVPPNSGQENQTDSNVQVEDAKTGIEEAGKENDSTIKKPPLISDLPVSCGICGATLRQSRNLRRHMELIHMKTETGMEPVRKRKNKKSDIPSVDAVQSSSITDNSQSEMMHSSDRGNTTQQGQSSGVMGNMGRGPGQQQQTQQQQQQTQHGLGGGGGHMLSPPPPGVYQAGGQQSQGGGQQAPPPPPPPPPGASFAHAIGQTHALASLAPAQLQFSQHHATADSTAVFRQTELLRDAGLYSDAGDHCRPPNNPHT